MDIALWSSGVRGGCGCNGVVELIVLLRTVGLAFFYFYHGVKKAMISITIVLIDTMTLSP